MPKKTELTVAWIAICFSAGDRTASGRAILIRRELKEQLFQVVVAA